MDIEEFVGETLKQVIAGVAAAQKSAPEYGAFINPPGLRAGRPAEGEGRQHPDSGMFSQNVDFDLAVTVGKSVSGGAKAGSVIAVLGLAAHGEAMRQEATVSRVKFAIPVVFPAQGTSRRDNRG